MSSKRDLAQESLRAFVDEVGPSISGLRERIDGELGSALFTGIENAEKQALANHELAQNFVGLLPKLDRIERTGGNMQGFIATTQSEAMFLQSAVLWANATISVKAGRTSWLQDWSWPFYVLGHCRGENTRSLLLAAAENKYYRGENQTSVSWPDAVQVRTYPTVAVDAYEAHVQRNLGHLYSESDLKLIRRDESIFFIRSDSPCSLSADKLPLPAPPATETSGVLEAIWKRHKQTPIQAVTAGEQQGYSKLPADIFASFDVLGAMQSLALRFDIVDATDSLLARTSALKDV